MSKVQAQLGDSGGGGVWGGFWSHAVGKPLVRHLRGKSAA